MTIRYQDIKAQLLSNPKVKEYYDELTPEFDKDKKKELAYNCSVLVENIAKEFPDSLEELHSLLREFKENQKNK
jgi:hypothetical protein